LTIAELPAHNHGNTGAGSIGNYPNLYTGVSGAHDHGALTGVSGAHIHSITDTGHTHTSNATGGQGTENSPVYGLATSTGTKTATETDNSQVELNVWTNPVGLTIDSNTTGITINSAGNHNHIINTDGSHNHLVTLTSVGSNTPHNNMPPYYVLIYIMKIH